MLFSSRTTHIRSVSINLMEYRIFRNLTKLVLAYAFDHLKGTCWRDHCVYQTIIVACYYNKFNGMSGITLPISSNLGRTVTGQKFVLMLTAEDPVKTSTCLSTVKIKTLAQKVLILNDLNGTKRWLWDKQMSLPFLSPPAAFSFVLRLPFCIN